MEAIEAYASIQARQLLLLRSRLWFKRNAGQGSASEHAPGQPIAIYENSLEEEELDHIFRKVFAIREALDVGKFEPETISRPTSGHGTAVRSQQVSPSPMVHGAKQSVVLL